MQVLHAPGYFDVFDKERDKIKENAIPKSTKDAATFKVKCFQDKMEIVSYLSQQTILKCSGNFANFATLVYYQKEENFSLISLLHSIVSAA